MKEKELLRKLYIDDKKSLRELAELLNTTKITVRKRLVYYGIPIRPRGRNFKELKLDSGD